MRIGSGGYLDDTDGKNRSVGRYGIEVEVIGSIRVGSRGYGSIRMDISY
jgi:hypothetical protein